MDVGAIDRAPAEMQKSFESEAASAAGSAAGIANVKLGMVLRRRGNCKAAMELWHDPQNLLTPRGSDDDLVWLAREHMGQALCFLGDGDGENAYSAVLKVWVNGNRDETNLVMAFAQYERDIKDQALGQLMVAMQSKNPRVHAALQKWFDGLGLSIE